MRSPGSERFRDLPEGTRTIGPRSSYQELGSVIFLLLIFLTQIYDYLPLGERGREREKEFRRAHTTLILVHGRCLVNYYWMGGWMSR